MKRTGSPWSECYICGLDFPETDMVRHYKTGKLVDLDCADELGAQDYRDHMQMPEEKSKTAERPVADQGQVIDSGYGSSGYGESGYGE